MPITKRGTRKCNENIRLKVALQIVNPAQTFNKITSPLGSTLNKFVMTVAPHKDMLPHGNTYPRNAAPITNKSNNPLLFQRLPLTYEPNQNPLEA